ncbi:MAG TPA: aldehyde dehydrogenase family protein, partial [Pseudobacillus sp.]
MSIQTSVLELKMLIGGEWRAAKNGDENIVINPATGEVIAKAPRATREETEEAIAAARAAFESGVWSGLTTHERAQYLNKIADKIDERFAELVELEVMDNGKLRAEAEFDVADAATCFRYYAG